MERMKTSKQKTRSTKDAKSLKDKRKKIYKQKYKAKVLQSKNYDRLHPAIMTTKNYYRDQILSKIEVVCSICNQPIYNPYSIKPNKYIPGKWLGGLTIDHEIPLSHGGKNNIDNLKPAHFVCNSLKSNSIDTVGTTSKIHHYLTQVFEEYYQPRLVAELSWIN